MLNFVRFGRGKPGLQKTLFNFDLDTTAPDGSYESDHHIDILEYL